MLQKSMDKNATRKRICRG